MRVCVCVCAPMLVVCVCVCVCAPMLVVGVCVCTCPPQLDGVSVSSLGFSFLSVCEEKEDRQREGSVSPQHSEAVGTVVVHEHSLKADWLNSPNSYNYCCCCCLLVLIWEQKTLKTFTF